MAKIAIIYWSGTGNTQAMALAIAEGVQSVQPDAEVFSVEDISAEQAKQYDTLVLGCPAMGAEVLEESVFEPFFTALEPELQGKKVALFGSYGWGDGEWMRDWEERVKAAGAELIGGVGLIANEMPDGDGIASCKTFGTEAANA